MRRTLLKLIPAILLLPLLVACENKITDENFAKLETGMTIAQVEAILGSGTDDSVGGYDIGGGGLVSGSGRSTRKTYSWEGEDFEIIVDFDKGEIISFRKRIY